MIQAEPSRLGSAAFLDCVAVLAEIAGIVAFIHSVVLAWHLRQWGPVGNGVVTWVFLDALAHIALNPSLINLTVSGDVRASDEAFGILSFAAKALVRLVPFVFGAGVIVGDLLLAWANVPLIRRGFDVDGRRAFALICLCAALPLASYVFFAFYHLLVALLCAILAVPRKLDELRENRRS